MNKGEKMKSPTKDDIREQKVTWKNKYKQEHDRANKLEIELEKLQWIDVSDRLPVSERVIAYTPNEDPSMEYRFIPANMFKQVASEATHWMPLPKAKG